MKISCQSLLHDDNPLTPHSLTSAIAPLERLRLRAGYANRSSTLTVMPIIVTVKLFAAYQEAYGQPELTLELPTGVTVADVRDRLLTEHPELEQWRDLTRFGVNLQFVEPDTTLQSGDEVVLIPPVSGG